VPDVVVSTAKGIAAHYAAAPPAGVVERHAAAFEAHTAARERAEQDAAAERADTPAADPEPDAPAPEEVDAEPVEDPPDDLELEVAAQVQGADREAAPAGTVDVAAQADGETVIAYVKRLREAGCTCPQPVDGIGAPRELDESCPVAGHGIPF
jgi:hypothetical protein